MEVGSSCAPSRAPEPVVQVSFPAVQTSVLDSLNRQREQGQLCDLSIHVQDHVFKAHRCVLAASSPYFHDQVLLKNMSTVSIPAVMDPLAFESVLSCAYTGTLRMLRDDIVNYLTVGSVLQMWHIVDKCTELLKEGRAAAVGGGGVTDGGGATEGRVSANPGCSSSNGTSAPDGSTPAELRRAPPPPVSESQSPSSTNYFSPRDGSGFGGNATAASGDGAGSNHTPSYCGPSGGEEALLFEEDEEEVFHQRKRARGTGSARRKNTGSMSEQEVGVSDSFGVSSYQDGEEPAAAVLQRPTFSQPSIMPRKQWVVVKTERADDDLIVVSGEEAGDDEDEDEEHEAELCRDRNDFNISNVRSLSELSSRSEAELESPADFCPTPDEYLKMDGGLMEQTLAQQLQESTAGPMQSSSRAVSALLGQVQSAAARAQLFPLDMQGNQLLLYSQGALSVEPTPLGVTGAFKGLEHGAAFKGAGLEHGAAHLSLQGLEGAEHGGLGVAGGGASGKVFMCHCGKTFTHKSMRDRHINMHLDLRPFHCPVCSKKFKMKHHLTEHMKTHTGLKPFDCAACGTKFMWRDSFMRHRAHCERRGEGAGPEAEPRGRADDGPEVMSSGRPVITNGNSMTAAALLGAGSQGVAMFGGIPMGQGLCEDDVCEVDHNSVT